MNDSAEKEKHGASSDRLGSRSTSPWEALPYQGRLAICLLLYFGIFLALYIFLAKKFVAPYLLIGLDGEALSFGDSATPCWLGFGLAMVAGLRWPLRGRIDPSLAAATLAPICAGGFCVLGYSLLAMPYAGLLLAITGVITFVSFNLVLRTGWITSVGMALSMPMLASLLIFVGMTTGAFSIQAFPKGEDAACWSQVQALALDEMEHLGIEDTALRAGPLPKREIATYSHSAGVLTVSASALQGASTLAEVAEGVFHALAHCSQARYPEAWPDVDSADVKLWLTAADGTCPSELGDEAAENPAFEQIELQAETWARDRSTQIAGRLK